MNSKYAKVTKKQIENHILPFTPSVISAGRGKFIFMARLFSISRTILCSDGCDMSL